MSVRIAICDDTIEDIELLKEALYIYDGAFEISIYTNGESLIRELMDSGDSIDILFLDIFMPGMDGVKTARRIQDIKKDIKIIFISYSREHYPQAYELFAFNYIVKPFDKERVFAVLDRALEVLGREKACKISFSYKSAAYSIDVSRIMYIESRDKLLLFHLIDGTVLRTYWKLGDAEKELPKQSFIRCHQSFIVNLSHIAEMGENYFRIGQAMIGISRRYHKAAKDAYYTYMFSRMGSRRLT